MLGIVEETVEEDPLLNFLPFETVSGVQVVWNREDSLGSESQFINPNDEIQESAPTYSKQTQTLSILADRIELDEFLVQTKSNLQAVEPTAMASKAKQMMRKFHRTFYYGVASGASSAAFAGLHNLVSTTGPDMTTAGGSGSTGAAGALGALNSTLALIKPGKPSVLAMNRQMLRRLSAPYIANVQYNIGPNDFGVLLQAYAGIPIMVTDWITMVETIASAAFSAETGGATTTIFAIKFGKDARAIPNTGNVFNNNGILGIQNGSMKIGQRVELEKKLGFTRKLRWFVSVILGSKLSLARYDGLTDAAWTV